MNKKSYENDVKSNERYEFGKNWDSFLTHISEDHILESKNSLTEMMGLDSFKNKTFLDVGSGSGVFSLCAKKLNAKVHSIDFDPNSVECTKKLKQKFYPNDPNWTITESSVLDSEYFEDLPKHDIVYSWGVLHHTGNMSLAFENISKPIKVNGILFISIYNDEGLMSKFWLKIKHLYNSSFVGKFIVRSIFYSFYFLSGIFLDLMRFVNPFSRYKEYKKKRGMSMIHDWDDWLGGLPFEVDTPENVVDYFLKKWFSLEKIRTTNRLGCNQFIFKKNTDS